MSFEEAWDSWVTPREAAREIRRHYLQWDDFVAEVGLKTRYRGSEVLGWLGY